MEKPPCLFIETFYTGSHKQLIKHLRQSLQLEDDSKSRIISLPGKKFHWRIRTSALAVAQLVPQVHEYKVLFASACTNLSELLGLRPDLHACYKILYFHENQLGYPVNQELERDIQFGYCQIVSALAADCIIYNSQFNRNLFISKIPSFFNKIPDFVYDKQSSTAPAKLIADKSIVLYYPLERPRIVPPEIADCYTSKPLHVIWPHRWEHDKNPEAFFKILKELVAEGFCNFKLSIVGEQFDKTHPIFTDYGIAEVFREQLLHIGFMPSKNDYYELLEHADVVISTSIHEFFGVAVMEAAIRSCFPLVPNRLVYPELYPKICLYNTDAQLKKRLKQLICKPHILQTWWKSVDRRRFTRFYEDELINEYKKILRIDS